MPPLQPGQRLKLITEIAPVLAAKSWAEIDVHLRQFGLPWSSGWNGTSHSYVLRQLEEGDDDMLLGLHAYLFPTELPPETAGTGHWDVGRFRVFMSHIAADKMLVSETKTALSQYGVDSFVAHEVIEPSKQWITEIEIALATCHAAVAFLTPAFHSSNWTDQELGYCLRRGVLIIPIRLGVDPYGFVGRFQGIQGTGLTGTTLAPLLFSLFLDRDLTAAEMASAVVDTSASRYVRARVTQKSTSALSAAQ